MTDGVKEPTNKVDRASYYHDYSRGSNILGLSGHDPRTANKRWMKSALAGARNPYDLATAVVGTVIFSAANLVYDSTHIKAGRYPHVPYKDYKKFKPCGKGCNFGSF